MLITGTFFITKNYIFLRFLIEIPHYLSVDTILFIQESKIILGVLKMLNRKTYTIQEMFDSVNKIVCNLSGYPPVNKLLREYPDGSRILDEGYSPFLPEEAYLTPENVYDFTKSHLDLENMRNFKWGIDDNILPALKQCSTDYGASINTGYIHSLEEISEYLNKRIIEMEGELNSNKEYLNEEMELD